MNEILNQLLSILKAAWQYRWYALAFAWIVSVGGWVTAVVLPDKYSASARVYVDTQSVLRPLMSGLAVQPNVDQQVSMMSRTLITRPNMEKVMRMADLDIRYKTDQEKQDAITKLMGDLKLSAAGRENLYTIAYSNQSPDDAKRVVQSLLTMFVEGSLGDKRKDAETARRFIDEQIKAYEQRLVLAENALKEFKRKNIGMMPGEGGDYFARVQQATARLEQARIELNEAENSRDALKRQMSGEDPVFVTEQQEAAGGPSNPEIESGITALNQKLIALRMNYTEQHPDIVAIKRVLQQLEQQKSQQVKTQAPSGTKIVQSTNPVHQQLSIALAEAEAKAAGLRARVSAYEAEATRLKSAVNMVPQVEADLTQLNRDYEINKKNYEALLSRRESAVLGGEMENTGIVDFRVIEPPRVSDKPVEPKRIVIISIATAAGIFGGFALAFLLSQLRPTVTDRRTAQQFSGVPLFGSVTRIWTDAQRRRRKRNLLILALSYLGLLGSYGAVLGALFLTGRV